MNVTLPGNLMMGEREYEEYLRRVCGSRITHKQVIALMNRAHVHDKLCWSKDLGPDRRALAPRLVCGQTEDLDLKALLEEYSRMNQAIHDAGLEWEGGRLAVTRNWGASGEQGEAD